jgi:ribosomal protein S27AE
MDDRVLARRQVHNALRSGRIVRPTACSRCGLETRITAHHPDYTRPLDVVWLCYQCHADEHRAQPEAP